VIAFLTGCKKDPLPAEMPADPVFSASLQVDGQQVEMRAGVDNYSMSPSFSHDSTGVLIFSGSLNPAGCGTCGWAIRVYLDDYKRSSGYVTNADSSFYIGPRVFAGVLTAPQYYECQFAALRSQTSSAEDFKWSFSANGVISTGSGTQAKKTVAAGTRLVTTFTYDDGLGNCNATHSRTFNVGRCMPVNGTAQRTGSANDLQYAFSCQPFNAANKYQWQFGDGTTASGWQATHTYAQNNSTYPAVLRVITPAGDTCFSGYQVPGSLTESCEANFNATITPVENTKRYGSVRIVLTDPQGQSFSSANVSQPAASTFFVTEEEAYQPGSGAAPSRKVKVTFNCLVSSSSGTLTLSNGAAVLAFGYQ
jgi:hypothetical protein